MNLFSLLSSLWRVVQDIQLMSLKLKSPTKHLWEFFSDMQRSSLFKSSLFFADVDVGVGLL